MSICSSRYNGCDSVKISLLKVAPVAVVEVSTGNYGFLKEQIRLYAGVLAFVPGLAVASAYPVLAGKGSDRCADGNGMKPSFIR